MSKRILLTTTSFQDTPGPHHQLLKDTGWEIITARGPLNEADTLALVGDIDGYICGDDQITRKVLEKALPRLKVLSKYGVGVDKIDIAAATALRIPVCYTPGVNQTTVAEHCIALMLALTKNLVEEAQYVRAGQWKRLTGNEILGKTLGIIGLGMIGKEVAIRARAFGLNLIAYGNHWDADFAKELGIQRANTLDEIWQHADIISLHTSLTPEKKGLINAQSIAKMKPDVRIINCARGELIDTDAMVQALHSGKVRGYAADVLDEEPPQPNHPLLRAPNCLITPHIGSRTHESVARQADKALQNLIRSLNGEKPLAQINSF